MRWKTLLAAGCLAPSLAGCNLYYLAARNIVNEPITVVDQLCRHHDLRSEARFAWREVREQYPRCLFSAEFRDGFLTGYSDYLDRGGNAQPPVYPPKKYSRNCYLTPEGQPLIQDYFIGFQYGVDVAVATGKRKTLVVPLLLPIKDLGSPKFHVKPKQPDGAQPLPVPTPLGTEAPRSTAAPPAGAPRSVPVSTPLATEIPRATAAAPVREEAPLTPRPTAVTQTVQAPPQPPVRTEVPQPSVSSPISPEARNPAAARPTMEVGLGEPSKFVAAEAETNVEAGEEVSAPDRLPPSAGPDGPADDAARALIPLPAPPPGVPVLPEGVPTPSVLDDLPVVPFNYQMPTAKPLPVEQTTPLGR